jgi:hypothetical protein
VRYAPAGLSSPGADEAAPLLVGVELDRARGDSDGRSPDGTRRFECKPNYALFVRADKLAVGWSPRDASPPADECVPHLWIVLHRSPSRPKTRPRASSRAPGCASAAPKRCVPLVIDIVEGVED